LFLQILDAKRPMSQGCLIWGICWPAGSAKPLFCGFADGRRLASLAKCNGERHDRTAQSAPNGFRRIPWLRERCVILTNQCGIGRIAGSPTSAISSAAQFGSLGSWVPL